MAILNNAKKIKKPEVKQEVLRDRKLCVCASIKPAMIVCRLFGMFPITTVHDENNRCVFVKNQKWLIYSIVAAIFCIIRFLIATDLSNFFEIARHKQLHPIIASINEVFYALYISILTILSIYRYPKFIETLNRINSIVDESLYCQSARRAVLSVTYGVILLFLIIIFAKIGGVMYVHSSEGYDTSHFSYKVYFNVTTQIEMFPIYIMFMAMSSFLMGMFGCYERFAINCFEFAPVHPLGDMNEFNNIAEFIGLIDYKLCDEIHPATEKAKKFPLPELGEYMRQLHENICIIMYEMNECFNPQFLVHVVVELTVLILAWYAVIMYFAYTFLSPIAATINFLNIIFVVIHTLGLLIFLKQAQQLQNLSRGLLHLLLEYSTRLHTPDEYQQIRIFIEKMNVQRPLSASGVFDIDLGIAGPVCANILTYVLVALQFDVPKI